jgi:protein-S-isoprenylcysteine O-methyltransferase Ste14
MRKTLAGFGSLLFLFIAPGTVAGLFPWWISQGRLQPPFFDQIGFRIVGGALIAAGLVPLLESFARFAWKGQGTHAPVFPTRHLVVSGFYRHVRNPMYLGVIAIVPGEALLFGSVQLLAYAVLVWLGFFAFVLAYEEPILRANFGDECKAFCRNVPRWLPRPTPWRNNQPGSSFLRR